MKNMWGSRKFLAMIAQFIKLFSSKSRLRTSSTPTGMIYLRQTKNYRCILWYKELFYRTSELSGSFTLIFHGFTYVNTCLIFSFSSYYYSEAACLILLSCFYADANYFWFLLNSMANPRVLLLKTQC